MRSSTTPIEPNGQSEQDLRAAMMRRLGIAEDPPAAPEPAQPRLTVVPSAVPQPEAAASYEQQLEDMLSRFGIDERPQAPAPQAPRLEPVFVRPEPEPEPRATPREEPILVRAEPQSARVAEFDIPAVPLQGPEPQAEPAPDPAATGKQSQEEMLQELRRQLKGSRMAAPSRVAVPGIPAPTKAQKRRKMGEMAYTRLIIWVLAILASGLMTYNVVKASVEHDRAMGRPGFVETIKGR